MTTMKLAGLMPVLLLGACAQIGSAPNSALSTTALAQIKPLSACSSLLGFEIPVAAIGLPTGGAVVNAAKTVTDTDTAGSARSYCMVTGLIKSVDVTASPIRFQVNLPIVGTSACFSLVVVEPMARSPRD